MADEIEKFDNITDDSTVKISKEDQEIFDAAGKIAGEIHIDLQATTPELLSDHKTEFKPPKAAGKGKGGKVLKPQLIDSICELQEKLDVDNKRPRSHFERMTKVELEELLAHLTNKGINKLNGTNHEINNKTSVTDDYEKENEPPERLTAKQISKDSEMGAKGLFYINLSLVKVLEAFSTTDAVREKIGTDLVGLTEDVVSNREELEKVLARIYEENKETIAVYVNPINMYMGMMSAMIINRAGNNMIEKNEKKDFIA